MKTGNDAGKCHVDDSLGNNRRIIRGMAGQQEKVSFQTVYLEATQRLPSRGFVKGCRRKTLITR